MRAGATTLRHLGCLAALCGSLQLGAPGRAGAAIPASERAALIAIYDSTNGAGWRYHTNWRNAEDTDFAPPGTEVNGWTSATARRKRSSSFSSTTAGC